MKKLAFLLRLSAIASPKACLSILLLSLFFFTSCNNDQKQIDTLFHETEVIHDAAMKDMADMNRVARELKTFMISATMTPEQSAVYTTVLDNIGKAENEMMEWMKGFKKPDELAPADAIQYLQDQKSKIEKNHSNIKAALEAGKKLQGN
jgi:hypothetical protein